MTPDGKRSFFVVDDDPSILEFAIAALTGEGHEVHAFTDAETALSEVPEKRPDCVLMDLMMPGTDGLDLCRQLSRHKSLNGTKLIIISGKPFEADRTVAYSCGAHGYITKPLNTRTFLEQVHRILEDKMELTFWGVRGTLPVPGEHTLKYGGNTSCVSIEFAKGQFLVFDAGTGIKSFSDSLAARNLVGPMGAKIFISHPHWDHINALPFFGPLYTPGNEFEILGTSHGNISMREMISAQMDGIYFPIRLKEFGARVYFRDLEEGEVPLGDGITVRTKLLNHPGKCLGYRVEYGGRSICYITDNELDPEDGEFFNPFYMKNLIRFVSGADVLITDATYTDAEYETRIGWGHSCISRVADLADTAGVKSLHLFHHDPNQTDADIDRKLEQAQAYLAEKGSAVECHAPCEGQMFKI